MSLRSDCTVDGYFAVVRRGDPTPTIRIFDGGNRLISVLRCLNAAAVVHMSWQGRGRFLACVFEDGIVLKFCKVTLRYELIYKLKTSTKISPLKDANHKPSDGCIDKPVSNLWSDESLKKHYNRWICASSHAFHREAGPPPSDKLIIDLVEKHHAAGVVRKCMKSWHLFTSSARSGHGDYTNTNASSWLSTRTLLLGQLVSGKNPSLTKSAFVTVSDSSIELMTYEELAKHYVFNDAVSIRLFLSSVSGNMEDLAFVREIADAYAIMEECCD